MSTAVIRGNCTKCFLQAILETRHSSTQNNFSQIFHVKKTQTTEESGVLKKYSSVIQSQFDRSILDFQIGVVIRINLSTKTRH